MLSDGAMVEFDDIENVKKVERRRASSLNETPVYQDVSAGSKNWL